MKSRALHCEACLRLGTLRISAVNCEGEKKPASTKGRSDCKDNQQQWLNLLSLMTVPATQGPVFPSANPISNWRPLTLNRKCYIRGKYGKRRGARGKVVLGGGGVDFTPFFKFTERQCSYPINLFSLSRLAIAA